MEDKKATDTFIKDSNVEILIANGDPQWGSTKKKTDYWAIGIISILMIGFAAYGVAKKLGVI